MIFQENNMNDLMSMIMQWGFIIIVVFVLIIILIKWVLKRSFPSLVSFFYFAVPTYIVNTILVASVGNDTLSQYTLFEMPAIALYFSPPIVWDALFAMGIAESRTDLALVSTFFIVFLPFWIAFRSSAGVNQEKVQNRIRLRKFISAWVIVTILGLGMSNFYFYILTFLVETQVLGLGIIFWIAIIVAIIFFILWIIGITGFTEPFVILGNIFNRICAIFTNIF